MASGEGGVNNGDLRSPSPLTRPSPVSYHIIFQGGIDPPENPLVAAYRELEEETVRTVYRVGALGALGRGGVGAWLTHSGVVVVAGDSERARAGGQGAFFALVDAG